MPAADGICDRAFDDAREPADRRHVMSLARHHKGPVKLSLLDGSDMHAAGVPCHEHRSQRHRLSDQPASDEFQAKPRVLRLERNLRSEAAFADRAIHDAAHRIGTTGKSEWKFHDVLDPRRVMGGASLALLTSTSGSRTSISGAIEASETCSTAMTATSSKPCFSMSRRKTLNPSWIRTAVPGDVLRITCRAGSVTRWRNAAGMPTTTRPAGSFVSSSRMAPASRRSVSPREARIEPASVIVMPVRHRTRSC